MIQGVSIDLLLACLNVNILHLFALTCIWEYLGLWTCRLSYGQNFCLSCSRFHFSIFSKMAFAYSGLIGLRFNLSHGVFKMPL